MTPLENPANRLTSIGYGAITVGEHAAMTEITGRRKWSAAVRGLGALAAAVVIAACSSSSATTGSSASTGSSSTQAASTASAAASGSPIKIGLICDCSAALASAGADAPDIYQAWAGSVNAAGGINGHQVQVIIDNENGTPGTVLTDVENMVNSDHIIALVDVSNLDETFASFVKSHNVPVIGINTSEEPFYSNSAFYPQGQTEDALFASVIDSAKSAGATNVGELYCAEAVQCQEAIAPFKTAAAAANLPLKFTGEISATAPNYTAQCVAAQQAGITSLFIADIAVVAAKVAQDCSQQGYHPIYVLDGEDLTASFATTTGLEDNLVGPSPNVPFYASTPAVTAMNAALDKYYPGLRENKSVYNEFSMGSWVAGLLFQAAAKAGGVGANGTTPTSAQVTAGLTSIKGDTLDGMAPPLTFTNGVAHPADCWFTYALKGGKFSLPNGTSTTCENS
jgi:branched-chain amino acid transport system substrate-binding protein